LQAVIEHVLASFTPRFHRVVTALCNLEGIKPSVVFFVSSQLFRSPMVEGAPTNRFSPLSENNRLVYSIEFEDVHRRFCDAIALFSRTVFNVAGRKQALDRLSELIVSSALG
jgi:hypothetical protein